MQSFYQYMMRYRGAQKASLKRQLADWIYNDHGFPKHSTSYDEISDYLEWSSPFNEAVNLFEKLWDDYIEVSQ